MVGGFEPIFVVLRQPFHYDLAMFRRIFGSCRHVEAGPGLLAGCVVFLVSVIYGQYLFGDRLFIFFKEGSDTYYQYWPFDRYFGDLLRSGHLASWSFRSGLGKEILPWSALLNPFMLFLGLLPPGLQPSGYAVKMALECACAAFLWRLYLSTLGIRGWAAVVVPLLYGFNGYLVLWGQHTSFGIAFSLIPLTLWAYEHLLLHRRWWPLVLSLAAFLVTSFYLFTMFSVFFAVFAAVRASVALGPGLRGLLWAYARLGLCYLGALLLSAWTTLPTYAYLRTSTRVAGQALYGPLSTFPWSNHAGLLRVFSNNVFGIDIGYRGPINYYEMPQLACGLLALLLLPQFFRIAPRRERWWAALTLAFVSLSLVSPFVAQIFVAFTQPNYRHSFAWIVFCLYLTARVLHRLEEGGELHRGLLAATCALLCLPPVLLTAAALGVRAGVIAVPGVLAARGLLLMRYIRPLSTMDDFMYTLKEELAPVLTVEMGKVLIGLILYTAVLLLFLPRRRRLAFGILLGLTVVELVAFNHPTVNRRFTLSKDYPRQRQGYFDDTGRALQAIRAADASWYRVDKTFLSVFLNDPLFQGYYGTSGYSSVNEPATLTFLEAMAVPTYEWRGPNYINGFGDRDPLNSLTAVKYLLSREPVERPGYRQLGTAGALRIYVNERALPLGFVYHEAVDPAAFAALSPGRKDLALLQGFLPGGSLLAQPALLASHTRGRVDPGPAALDAAACEERYREAVATLRREPFVTSSFREDRIRGRVAAQGAGVLFLSVPFNRGWQAIVDGRPEAIHRINLGFVGLPLAAGEHTIELRFVPEGSRLGLGVSLLAAIVLAAGIARESRRRRQA